MQTSELWYAPPHYFPSGAQEPPVFVPALGLHERMGPRIVHHSATADYIFMHFHTAARLFVEGQMLAYPPNMFVIWGPNTEHLYGSQEGSWSHSWIHLDGPEADEIIQYSSLALDRPVQLKNAALIDWHLQAILTELKTHAQPDPVILKSHFSIWMSQLRRGLGEDGQEGLRRNRLLAVLQYIEDNIAQSVTLTDLAEVAQLSIGHFSAEFKACFGSSPIDYVLDFRLRRAAHLLQDLHLSISEIAARTGFADPFYFSKQFKRRYRLSPSEFRRSSTGNALEGKE
ncbi:hypothetical protein CCAX7_45760 [Capsulimonas corticalis]|uniref:Uncharacterized protein n=1 Tax=Capsulimonas corticalis TaxID=2219043 RepID=A0A402D5V5_9BACT|nr:helix-turn-helix domain-containing protein [Capsulimonas corticalis]BDI32525.1 hypothetical protein CCAX7_45760 [Capsulimonas corticalis]